MDKDKEGNGMFKHSPGKAQENYKRIVDASTEF